MTDGYVEEKLCDFTVWMFDECTKMNGIWFKNWAFGCRHGEWFLFYQHLPYAFIRHAKNKIPHAINDGAHILWGRRLKPLSNLVSQKYPILKTNKKKTLKILFVFWKWCCMQIHAQNAIGHAGGEGQYEIDDGFIFKTILPTLWNMKFDMKFDHKSQANSINAAKAWHNTTR